MKRGADEANEESARLGQARQLGEALGALATIGGAPIDVESQTYERLNATTLPQAGKTENEIDRLETEVARLTAELADEKAVNEHQRSELQDRLQKQRAAEAELTKERADTNWLRTNLEGLSSEKGAALRWAESLQAELEEARKDAWQLIETAPKNPRTRVLLKWVSGGSEWICIGAWDSVENRPSLKAAYCPPEGWLPDAGTCIPRNQKDCVSWKPLDRAAAMTKEKP
jgi:hypothetical protein